MLRVSIRIVLLLLLLSPVETFAAAIDIFVTPDRPVLGETDQTTVTIRLASQPGKPCEAVRIQASTGTVTEPRYELSGDYTAIYNLPSDYFPRFALLAATATCSGKTATGIAVIKLYGAGEVEVKSTPFSKVTLQIGRDTFGPVTTNRYGKARIPIVVGPGIQTGLVGDKVIDLNLPKANRILTISETKSVSVDRDEKDPADLWIYAIDPLGKPLRSADFEVTVEKGKIPSIDIVAPGIYNARYLPPDVVGDGEETVTIGLKGDASSVSREHLVVVAGEPSSIVIEPSPKVYTAGTGAPLRIIATVVDRKGNPTIGDIDATASFGELSELSATPLGGVEMALTIPDRFEGRHHSDVTMTLRQNPEITSTLPIPLETAPPKAIDIRGLNAPIPADGLTTVRLPMSVQDEFGNPIRELTIALSSSSGTTPLLAEHDGDHYRIPYTPPLGRGKGKATIEAKVATLTTETQISLTNRTYLLAITPMVGYITNFGHMHAPYINAEIEMSLWYLLRGAHASVDIGYYFSKGSLDSESYASTMYAIPLIASLGYRYHFIPRLFVAISAGVGVHFIRNRNESSDGFRALETSAQLGIHAMSSIGFRVGPGNILVRAGYVHAKPTHISSLSGHIGGFTLFLGFRYGFDI